MNRFGLLAIFLVAGCNVSVQHGLDEAAANEVVSALDKGGLASKKQAEGDDSSQPRRFSVSVAQGDAPAAIELLNAHGLPKSEQGGFAQLYGEPSLIPTATEERARFIQALTGEIEKTLTSVEGVVSARVHVVPEERDVFANQDAPRSPSRAAVLLRIDDKKTGLTDDQVRSLVAGSVPGLVPTAVAVVRTKLEHRSASTVEALVAVGPLRVAAGSRLPIIVGIALATGALAAMAVLLLVAARKLAVRGPG